MEFTCEVACRTPSISGCSVVLNNPGGGGMSFVVTGLIEDISPRFVTVVIHNVDLMISYTYTASSTVIVNKTSITSNVVKGRIPALIISSTTCKIAILYNHF